MRYGRLFISRQKRDSGKPASHSRGLFLFILLICKLFIRAHVLVLWGFIIKLKPNTRDALYSNFFAANGPRAKPKRGGWVQPLQDHVKINVDAAFDADSRRGSTGAVTRDCSGKFIVAGNFFFENLQVICVSLY
jgi:hypothetical protein